MSFDEQLERAQADGRMTPGDADEVRHFAGFLAELAAAGVPPAAAGRTPVQHQSFLRIWRDHYPEDYARAVAENRGRDVTVDRAIDELEAPMEYGHPTTSPASPGGPGPEEDPHT